MSQIRSRLSSFVRSYGEWLIVALAAVLRFWNLGYPQVLVFDETYYVKDAWTLSNLGYEAQWPENANDRFEAGDVNGFLTEGSFIVHPQFGKWLIAIPMQLFGAENAYTWRISVAIFGLLAVWLIMKVANLVFEHRGWSLVAGFFMAIDGLAIVMSRTALLDNFLMFFALLAFYFLLRDREAVRVELTVRAAMDEPGGVIWRRPWLIALAFTLALATSIKWSGVYFALVFGLYIVISETLLRRRLGLKHWASDGFIGQTLANLVLMVPIYISIYVAGWASWLLTSGGYDRQWAADGGNKLEGILGLLPGPLQSLIAYHQAQYGFHINLQTPHGYMSNPFTWPFVIRPVSFWYEGEDAGTGTCTGNENCASAITALGNPFIWWAAAIAAIYFTVRYFMNIRGSRNEGLILIGIAAGYLPWLMYTNRTVFQFYSIAFLPWMILILVHALRTILRECQPERVQLWRRLITTFVILCAAMSLWLSNIWFGYQTPYWYWYLHMWIPAWI